MLSPRSNNQKNYWNDPRPFPKPVKMVCCDCRNILEIKWLERYPHGPEDIKCCPICGASALEDPPTFRLVTE
jgi:LSD1 subclass zinc finger protein